ncbi:hypothetical protein FA95DRAFT_1498618 [Auriscalpium vulgare]|uniref:Uncharacterized protein n=1 Tax=Auriscalpium vulgare TaxID=40419 RepID=A0ACB8RIU7_9AGAM|nr:hypothetical protein FA95DRAFT_1498618 [Auriscalpium vulgare]
MSTPPADRDQLLSVGKQCTLPTCHLVDFLPFTCTHCSEPYCAEHFRPGDHACARYDESAHNRVAPACPLCGVPVAIPPGEDPNVRMDAHFTSACAVLTGRPRNAKSGPTCARGKCGKVLFAPIRCDKCQKQYCPEHRFPADHACNAAPAAPASSSKRTAPKFTSTAATASASAMAAFKRATASTKPSAPSAPARAATASAAAPLSSSGTKPNSALPKVFSKTDR